MAMMAEEKQANRNNESSFKKMTFGKKVQHIYGLITLEPLIICFLLSSTVLELTVQNLNLEKACLVNLNYNQTVCDALRVRDTANYTNEEKAVQKLVSQMTGWKAVLISALSCLLILFFGSWSDRHGKRKPCILIPLCGDILMAFLLLLCVYFDKTPIELAIFVQVFFPAISGSNFTMMAGVFSYIADITNEKERTFRIGIITLVNSISVPFGMAMSGVLLKRIGFYGVFSMAGTMYIIALLYGIFVVKEVPPKEKNDQMIKKSFLADFFDFGHIKEIFLVAFKANVRNRLTKILAIMAIIIITVGPLYGEMPIFYLFTRYKFHWTEEEFGFYSTFNMALHLVGTAFAVGILSSRLKVDDALIGAVTILTKVPSSFVYAFSQVGWHMYIGPVVELTCGAAIIAMRSLASKTVPSNEIGQVNSLFGIVGSISPLVYSPILVAIYSATISKMPGAFFLFGGFMSIPGALLFIWIYMINRAEAKEREAAADEQKAVNEKLCVMYLRNEDLSMISSCVYGTIVYINTVLFLCLYFLPKSMAMMAAEKKANQDNETSFKKITFGKKVQHICSYITLEPLIICFLLPSALLGLTVENFNLEKACLVNLNYNQTVCDALRVRDTANYTNEEVAVQKLISEMTQWRAAFASSIPCLLILLFGSWSDRHGKRKPCILIPLCGDILMVFLLLLCVYFDKTPIELTIFVQVFFPAITGSSVTMMVGVFSYMTDITNEKERTLRIGLTTLICAVSVPVGSLISGVLPKIIGFYGVFSLVGTLHTMALLYGIFVVKEVPPKEKNNKIIKKSFLVDFFDFGHIKETFFVAFKKRDKNRRTKILAIIAFLVIAVGPQNGEARLFYYFTRFQLNWSEQEYGFFSTYSMALNLVGTSLAIGILSSFLKLDDALIGAVTILTKVPSSFVYAFSQVGWHMYIGPVVELTCGAATIAMRSLASKTVPSNEIGKINSLFGIIEALLSLAYSPIFHAIYTATLTKMPGAFFLFGGFMSIPGALLFIWIYMINRAEAKDNIAADEQKATNVKLRDMYLQNEDLSMISEMKD
ncbi:uncharacterized protein LOC129567949 [Sitodiplosis mosellana]|uniref:uncharacterized protein LOC129567949 n=1 Tax=Sitodiplosis mosellana TaxID=263140 RepID=UPI00244406BF|nr:uncharacterized protein LOC129567949 [Sitodiplosis mosellana]